MYRVLVTQHAKEDLLNNLICLAYEKKNPQAVVSVEKDFYDTLDKLSFVAGSFRLIGGQFNKFGSRRIPFVNMHNYFLIYHIVNNQVIVDRMYHVLQNPKNIK